MSSAGRLPESLPTGPGYTHVLGVPVDAVERLSALRETALDGAMTLDVWLARHAETLAGGHLAIDPATLGHLVARVNALAMASLDDFDDWLFLAELQKNLQLLQVPDPGREMQQLADALPTLIGEQTRAQAERRMRTLRAMAGRATPEVYEPGTRMFKALRVGTLEETNRWLQAAVAEHPGASVQDLLTRAAIEVAEAKQELDRYDALKSGPHDRPTR